MIYIYIYVHIYDIQYIYIYLYVYVHTHVVYIYSSYQLYIYTHKKDMPQAGAGKKNLVTYFRCDSDPWAMLWPFLDVSGQFFALQSLR